MADASSRFLYDLLPAPPHPALHWLSWDPCGSAAVPAPSFRVPPGRRREHQQSIHPVPPHLLLGRDCYKGSDIWSMRGRSAAALARSLSSHLKPPEKGSPKCALRYLIPRGQETFHMSCTAFLEADGGGLAPQREGLGETLTSYTWWKKYQQLTQCGAHNTPYKGVLYPI